MSKEISSDLAAAMAARKPVPVGEDRLERVRDAVRRLRDLVIRKEELNLQLKQIQSQITELQTRELVDVFNEVGVPALSLAAEGNYPAYDAEKVPFYSAKIPEERETEAYAWFEAEGHGDLVKATITVALGVGELDVARAVEQALVRLEVDYSSKFAVHASSLKAFVKRETEAGHPLPLDLLGAHIGEIVNIDVRKEKKHGKK